MSQPHLHALIGKEIYGHKKKLFDRLKSGTDLETAVAQFFCELSEGFDRLIKAVKEANQ